MAPLICTLVRTHLYVKGSQCYEGQNFSSNIVSQSFLLCCVCFLGRHSSVFSSLCLIAFSALIFLRLAGIFFFGLRLITIRIGTVSRWLSITWCQMHNASLLTPAYLARMRSQAWDFEAALLNTRDLNANQSLFPTDTPLFLENFHCRKGSENPSCGLLIMIFPESLYSGGEVFERSHLVLNRITKRVWRLFFELKMELWPSLGVHQISGLSTTLSVGASRVGT